MFVTRLVWETRALSWRAASSITTAITGRACARRGRPRPRPPLFLFMLATLELTLLQWRPHAVAHIMLSQPRTPMAPTMVRVHPPFQVIRMEDAPLATVFPLSAVVNFLMLFAPAMTHPLSIRPMSATRMLYFRPRAALSSVSAYGVPPNPLVRSASGFVTGHAISITSLAGQAKGWREALPWHMG